MLLFLRILFLSLLAGLLAVVVLHLRPFSPAEPFYFEVRMTADADGRARLNLDRGGGYQPWDIMGAVVRPGTHDYRFPINESSLRALRFWPLDRTGKVTIHRAAIVDPLATINEPHGKVLHRFLVEPTGVEAATPNASNPNAGGLEIEAKPGAGPEFRLPQALNLWRTPSIRARMVWPEFTITAAATAFLLFLGHLLPPAFRSGCRRFFGVFPKTFERVPRLTLLLAAAAATTLSCHPVIFSGKSFVSPNNGALLLYDDLPTVPGGPPPPAEDPHGSDIGALMWAHVPYSIIQHEAIFKHGELPLWNRYNYCGTPLLGQGISMIGDPLHWLTIYHAGAAWSWDAKFLLAKMLFALGIGFCVRAATGRLWVAALVAFSSAFLGFFSYRLNHPAFFALCYAPWILLAWLRASSTEGRVWPWAMLIALANFWQLNSGVVKESAMLIAGLNFTGVLLVIFTARPARERCRRLFVMAWGCALFLALSAPCWLLFFDALSHAWTSYGNPWQAGTAPVVEQIQPSLLLGLFDDLFYRQVTPWESHFNPSVNFLILLGCVWALVHVRELLRERIFVALGLGALLPAALIFGVIPSAWIARLPFLGNIGHVDNTFSVVLIVHLIVLAGFGLHALWENIREPRAGTDNVIAFGLVAVLFALFGGFTQASHRNALPGFGGALQATFSPFFYAYGAALFTAVLALPWILRSLRRQPGLGATLLGALALFAIHFRHAMWNGTQFDFYVVNPQPRADLAAASTSLEKIRARIEAAGQPVRIAGFKHALAPGYNALLGFEHFAGAEPLVGLWQRELCEATGGIPLWNWRWRLGADGNLPRTWRLCDLWGVSQLVAMPCDLQPGVPVLLDDLAVTENPNAWPRAFFTDRLIACDSLPDFLTLLESSSGKSFAAITAKDPTAPAATATESLGPVQSVAAKKYGLTANSTAFTIEATGPGIAVLTETYEESNWRVTLDGKPARSFRVNHAFHGVAIPSAGTHTLRFEYWPHLLSAALWASAAGLVFFVMTPALAFIVTAGKSASADVV